MRILTLLVFILTFIGCNKNVQKIADTKSPTDRIEILLSKMTIEEKIGQMVQYNGFWDSTGPAPSEGDSKKKYEHLRTGQVGSVLNVSGVENVRNMQKVVVEESRLGIPLIFGLDVIHGHKTLSPIPLAESASWDLELIEASARMAAKEATARGINWTFAPMVDISRDARWGRVMEGAGEDVFLGTAIARARVRGFQGNDLSATNTLAATAKHFAAYGFAESGRDYNTADIGTSTLYNVVLPPFKACVEEGICTFMNSFNVLNGIPATGDKFLQRELLKGKWNFDGFIVSDWGSANEMIDHGYAKDLKHAAELAANAGSDMDMESYAYIKHLKEVVEEGKIPMELIDDSVRRILKIKEKLGLFDDPYKYCDIDREKTQVFNQENKDEVLEIAKKSIVLLKNENNILPIKKDQQNILVIGELAADKTSPLGSWRIGSDDNTATSVLEGIDNLGIDYHFSNGVKLVEGNVDFINEVKINESDKTGFEEAITNAASADLVIMVLGEHGFQSGEGRSRTKLGFPGLQQELLEQIAEVNKNIILVNMSGRPLVLTWADENIPAIVQAWQLGTRSGDAIASVLFGEQNPCGKLPMSFPRSVGQVPIYYNKLNTGRPGPNELVFWSHYIDESNDPLYPFGYGLSYTDFTYSNVNIQITDTLKHEIKVNVDLKNNGDVDGREVAQLYIRDKVASVSRPIKELKGFQLADLKAGESTTLTFKLSESELGFYDNNGNFIFESGEFEIFVGGSSDTKMSKTIEL